MTEGNVTEVVELSMQKIAVERALGASTQELSNKYGISVPQMTSALREMNFIKTRGPEAEDSTKGEELTEREKKFQKVCKENKLEEPKVHKLLSELGMEYKTGRRKGALNAKKYSIIYDLKLDD